MTIRIVLAALTAVLFGLAAGAQTQPAGGLPVPDGAEAAIASEQDWRPVDPENLIIFDTSRGRVLIEMLPQAAPKHAEQFRAIIRSGDFDGTAFHRVIKDFMAQGGDIFALKGRESGLPDIPGEFTFRRGPAEMPIDTIGPVDVAQDGWYLGFPIKTQAQWLAEMSKDGLVEAYIPHCPSVVSTARTDDPNSANSQFFLMRGRAEHLDKSYTAWGRVLDGQDHVMAIKLGEPPANPDILTRARMAADVPEGERPQVFVMRTDGPAFNSIREDAALNGPQDVCEHPPVPVAVFE